MQKTISIFFILFAIMSFSHAQERYSISKKRTIKIYEEARVEYSRGNIDETHELLEKAIDREPEFIEAMLLLGDVYHSQEKWSKEREILKQALQVDSTFYLPTYYNLGIASYYDKAYDESLIYLKKYRNIIDDESAGKRAEAMIERVSFVRDARANAHDIVLKSAGSAINSEFDEYWPSLTADEQTIVITVLTPRDMNLFRERDGNLPKSPMFFQEDFYISHSDSSGKWEERRILPGHLNTDSNEGAQTLSADGNWMFFTACGRSDSKGSCDIYFSRSTNQGWSTPINIGAPVNTTAWESQPHFSADGQTLYFISNRDGGIGGKDIWQVSLKGTTKDGVPFFGDLKNLGETINTKRDENSPFLHHDGQTLYFSSNGHLGIGGMDIFMSYKLENPENRETQPWSHPVNLGWPINTEKDEIGLVVTAPGSRAYFATDGHEAETNVKNIYSFNLPVELRPNPVLYVKGKVYDEETGEVLPADFELKNLADGETVVTSRGSQFTGEFLVCLPICSDYAFKADHPGYLFYSGHFNLTGEYPIDKPYHLDIGLKPIKEGARVRLENVFFETDSYTLKPESKVELKEVVAFLENNPEVRIMLEGHTDNVGTEAYNLELSENRARAVYQYLINSGIDPGRLEYTGYGFSQPIDTNSTEEGRARNRRTEMRIL
jgi:outer membrane protein OmpA-like peptidoglycan-associated protein